MTDLTDAERITALTAFAKQEYASLGRLIEETSNLSQPQKIDALGSLVQLLTQVDRVEYTERIKGVIDDLMSVIGREENTGIPSLRPASGES
jgi:hypothetical protein